MTTKNNSDWKIIEEEIENALDIYLAGFYKTAFALPPLHQQLRQYVIQKLAESYNLTAESSTILIQQRLPYHSLELRLELEKYTQEAIFQMVQENHNIQTLALRLKPLD
ncbi:MAG TPA: hypothetical protein DDW51_10995 [Cyanobacteria bacterium UBA11367]|nr:hypothetical protein [Cyanobacteria bacterium UBA11367]HBE56469.1 hypothetical protein [Cyanobacteria bacterium UBA11366]HBK66853.1 hypothetical protein [Cyanobacteria bacterium UBA11166]HCA96321.1 hypothetical protein [Cyanobacteria bacterium UBA9226]